MSAFSFLAWSLRTVLLAASALIFLFLAIWGAVQMSGAAQMPAEYLIGGSFFVFRMSTAGFMVINVESWSCWNRFRRSNSTDP